jgi:hypothetical protein
MQRLYILKNYFSPFHLTLYNQLAYAIIRNQYDIQVKHVIHHLENNRASIAQW